MSSDATLLGVAYRETQHAYFVTSRHDKNARPRSCDATLFVDACIGARSTTISFSRAMLRASTIGVLGRGIIRHMSFDAFFLQSRVSLFALPILSGHGLGSHLVLGRLPFTNTRADFLRLAGMIAVAIVSA